jgi:ferredoxin-NADP reductase
MSWVDLSYLLTGAFLCLVVCGQIVLWTRLRWLSRQQGRTQLLAWQAANRRQLDQQAADARSRQNGATGEPLGHWQGWRQFRVAELRRETANSQSIYLVPVDGKPVARFRPGQYLTIRIQLPGERRPQIRCYSLSASPARLPYRITVKQVTPAGAVHPRSVSEHLNRRIRVGDLLDVKAPAGEFVLREGGHRPLVMMAAGVGITPLYSMLCALLESQRASADERPVILFYGNTKSADTILASELANLSVCYSRLAIVNCYSQASEHDPPGPLPCHYRERLSVRLMERLLPTLDADYYLCGPPSFMQTLYQDLTTAGVAPAQIHYEAFGPASVTLDNPPHPLADEMAIAETLSGILAFTRSNKQVQCPVGKSILEVAENCEVPIDSGCRAGNCGTCAVKIVKGSVKYPRGNPPSLEPGTCLACIAQPQGEVQVEA